MRFNLFERVCPSYCMEKISIAVEIVAQRQTTFSTMTSHPSRWRLSYDCFTSRRDSTQTQKRLSNLHDFTSHSLALTTTSHINFFTDHTCTTPLILTDVRSMECFEWCLCHRSPWYMTHNNQKSHPKFDVSRCQIFLHEEVRSGASLIEEYAKYPCCSNNCIVGTQW